MCLVITAGDAWYNDKGSYLFLTKLLNLRHLKLDGVKFAEIELTHETTPELRTLRVVNLGDQCDFKVIAPKLKDVTIHYFKPPEHRDASQINEMLERATKLERFDSYKLWVYDDLEFFSNALQSVYIHRSDGLPGLTFWAPNLTELKLQANYALQRVTFLPDHLLSESLPDGHVTPKLTVTPLSVDLSPEALGDIAKHPNAVVTKKSSTGGRNFGAQAMEAQHNVMFQATQRAKASGMDELSAIQHAIAEINKRDMETYSRGGAGGVPGRDSNQFGHTFGPNGGPLRPGSNPVNAERSSESRSANANPSGGSGGRSGLASGFFG